MRRRTALHLLAGPSLPLSGCLDANDGTGPATESIPRGGADETTGTDDGGTESADAAGIDDPLAVGDSVTVDRLGTLTVESIAVQRSVIHHELHRELYEPDDAQLLVVETRVDGYPEFLARIDGEPVRSSERVSLYGGDYAASVPVEPVDTAAVVLAEGDRPAWAVPEEARRNLAAAPAFHLHDATVREDGDETVLALTVENVGDRDGTFRAVVDQPSGGDIDASATFPVPAGETVTESVRNPVVDAWSAADFAHDVTPTTRRFAVDR